MRLRMLVAVAGGGAAALGVVSSAGAARIVGEWNPGFAEAELGGELVVDGYGVSGLGAYEIQLDDGSTVLAVCVQADVGHSLTAEYVAEAPASASAELDYLAWRYLAWRPATDEQAAAVNLLAWLYTGAQRRTGGAVWQGADVEVRVLGVGRMDAVEAAVAGLRAEAAARRGPWTVSELAFADGQVSVLLTGPGGPIAGEPVTFTVDTGVTVVATTAADGRAIGHLEGLVGTIRASVEAPGATQALAAAGSQRLVMVGPPVVVVAELAVPPPPPTTTTTTSTTTTSTTTTTLPATTTTTTLSPTTTSTTSTTTTTTSTSVPPARTVPPASSPPPPPSIPVTGTSERAAARLGAILFALGAGAVLVATPRRGGVSGGRRGG